MTIDEKLDFLMETLISMKGDIQDMKGDIQNMKGDIQTLNVRMDGLELQIKSTERMLKNEIHKSESLILDEVERVHEILNAHIADKRKHNIA